MGTSFLSHINYLSILPMAQEGKRRLIRRSFVDLET